MTNNKHINPSQHRLLSVIRINTGRTAYEYADICLLGVLTVQNQLEHLRNQGLITSPHKRVNPSTGEICCAYYPTVRLPIVNESRAQ